MSPTDLPPAPVTGDFAVDPGASGVEFATRHLFGLGAVNGTFAISEGRIELREPAGTSRVTLTVPADSFDTGHAQRDGHVKGAGLLDVAKFPVITFISDRITPRDGAARVEGTLTAHGVHQTVPVEVGSVSVVDGRLLVEATARVDRYAFGVTGKRGMAGRYLQLTFHVVADRV
jgi:polyisoprenoid-binding protein YceI